MSQASTKAETAGTNPAKTEFTFTPSPDQSAETPVRHPVIVIGAGPVGLAAALDLAQRGRKVVVLDDDNCVSTGSRAICWSKRALEIMDRLGIGAALVEKGVTWQAGKVFFGEDQLYGFDLLPETGHRMPAFINLQQYHFEDFTVREVIRHPNIDLRWNNRLAGVTKREDGVEITIETPDGEYNLIADYLLAADGARSATRRLLGLDFKGQVFRDRFLIADVIMKADFPTERWFWFDPPFNRGQSALLHKQPDDVWRIDLQLGWEADPEEERKPERVIPRLKAMLGEDSEFELEWVSVYSFQCRRLEQFRHGRIFFIGDSAHQVSPFGARGANSGLQDADNLVWKLDLVLDGRAPESLLDSYHDERAFAADENILNSTRSTDFITPKNAASRAFRDAVLDLARDHAFARQLVNSGRLSLPSTYADSVLNTPDGLNTPNGGDFAGLMVPGAPCVDAPVTLEGKESWLLHHLGGGFSGLYFAGEGDDAGTLAQLRASLAALEVPVELVAVFPPRMKAPGGTLVDRDGLAAERYDARPGSFTLIRPDQHVTARWRACDPQAVGDALQRALGKGGSGQTRAQKQEGTAA